jgi:hypothetical protein
MASQNGIFALLEETSVVDLAPKVSARRDPRSCRPVYRQYCAIRGDCRTVGGRFLWSGKPHGEERIFELIYTESLGWQDRFSVASCDGMASLLDRSRSPARIRATAHVRSHSATRCVVNRASDGTRDAHSG